MNEGSGPTDVVIDLVFDARDGQRPLEVALTCDPEPVRATIAERGTNGVRAHVELDDVASPGRSVRVGTRQVHLQYLRARNDLCRGPLLVFEGGAPLPCWLPRRGFRKLLPRGNTTTLAVFVVGEGQEDSHAREVRNGLLLCEALMKGTVSPGFEESAFATPPPPGPTPAPVLRASDLNAEAALVIDAARESDTYKDYDDGGVLIAYQYRFDASDGVMVNSQAVLHTSEAGARSHYDEVIASLDAQKLERDPRGPFGDESTSWVVRVGEDRVGHALVTRMGLRTMYFVFSGYYFAGAERYVAFVRGKLEGLFKWKGGGAGGGGI
jgi:hypothetical protein